MKKFNLLNITIWFVFLSVSLALLCTPVCAEKIPALAEISVNLSPAAYERLTKQKAILEKELSAFQKAAALFNAKDAKDQSDAEYEALDARRSKYINAARAFNQEVAVANKGTNEPQRNMAYTVQFNVAQGEFEIKNADGSKLTNKSIQTGSGARVDTGTRVTTGPTGRLKIILPDETVFTIGPNSDMVIDEFVFDPDNSPKKILVRITIGMFRWVTGKVARKDPANMKVALPVMAVGIRGTDFETVVEPDGSGYVKLFSGELQITPKKDGKMFVMKGDTMFKFKPDGTFNKPERIK